jgi:DNA-binding transcriptional regulator LsrR (DeoR family)
MRQSRIKDMLDEDLLFRVCGMWSQEPELKNNEIARRLRIPAKRVTMLVQRAKSLGYIRRVFTPPARKQMEDELRERLAAIAVRRVFVVPGEAAGVGHAAARYFEARGRNRAGVVVDGGQTVAAFVQALRSFAFQRLTITPIAADPASYATSAFELTLRMAAKYPDRVRLNRLPSWSQGRLKELIERIQRDARSASFVFLGVGPWQQGFTALDFVEHLGLDAAQLYDKYRSEVVAAAAYCPLGANGGGVAIDEIDCRMPRSLSLSDLRTMAASAKKHVVMLAASAAKEQAVRSALRACACNTLIVDDRLAAALLAGEP